MASPALKRHNWPRPAEDPVVIDLPAPDSAPETAKSAPERRLTDDAPATDDATSSDRRGPMRPETLAPSRTRVTGGPLVSALKLIDAFVLVLVATLALEFASPLALIETQLFGLIPYAAATAATLWALGSVKAYAFRAHEPLARHTARIAVAILAATGLALTLTAPFFGLATIFARLAPWMGGAFIALAAVHAGAWAIVRHLREAGRLTSNIVIVGAGRNAERLIAGALASGDVNILGIFDDRADRAPKTIKGVPVLGGLEAMIEHRIMPFVDKIVIAVPSAAQGRVRQLVEKLGVLPNPVALIVDVDGEIEPGAFARMSDTPLAWLSGRPDDARRALVKRAQDLVIASIGLVLAAPIMALVALVIRLDSPGPIFFRQRRHGFNNEEIVVWKFRSMRVDATDASASRQVSADDDRVTRVGRIIRKTSLDELPQIFNVLTGEMSLVGPRPHAIGMKTGDVESAKLVAEYAHRHRMKPGITGWAAIHGSRGPVDTPEAVKRRVALDIEYIERQSFWLDLFIIALTIPCLLGDSDQVR